MFMHEGTFLLYPPLYDIVLRQCTIKTFVRYINNYISSKYIVSGSQPLDSMKNILDKKKRVEKDLNTVI